MKDTFPEIFCSSWELRESKDTLISDTSPYVASFKYPYRCRNCGLLMQEQTPFCPHCGIAMDAAAASIVADRLDKYE